MDKKKYYEIEDENKLRELNDYTANFHEGYITKVEIESVDNPHDEDYYEDYYNLKITLSCVDFAELEYKPESLITETDAKPEEIELCFRGVKKFFFAPPAPNYDFYIYDALLEIKEGMFVFNAFRDGNLNRMDDCNCFITAEKLSYRMY